MIFSRANCAQIAKPRMAPRNNPRNPPRHMPASRADSLLLIGRPQNRLPDALADVPPAEVAAIVSGRERWVVQSDLRRGPGNAAAAAGGRPPRGWAERDLNGVLKRSLWSDAAGVGGVVALEQQVV